MRRAAFLTLAVLPALASRVARAQNDADPATSSGRPALRVLLGPGDAVAETQDSFFFAGRRYRGAFTKLADGQIVSVVDLEEYLYGVVPGEMPPGWPAAALQAQAICSRTYVLQRSDPRRAYDLVPSELDQVYRGTQGESPAATSAVSATAGSVLTFGGTFARVAYSSCCGGHTEAASDAWAGPPIAYLEGVVCPWCAASPNFRWVSESALAAIGLRCADSLSSVGALRDVQIVQRDASGRVRAFELLADRGSATMQGAAFRRALGPRTLRSLLVTNLARSQDLQTISIAGGGLGHGVGLCQWGAHGMAIGGRSAVEILALYFPGTVVTDLER